MNRLLTLVLLVFSVSYAVGQNFEDEWEGFFSYVEIRDIDKSNDQLYVASQNAFYSFDLITEEIITTTSVNGLDGGEISAIHYSEDFGATFLGYENGLIEVIIDGEDDIVKVVDILEKVTIPPNRKQINHFNEYEGKLYIAAGFGISVYDIQNLEFGDSFFIGNQGTQINVSQTTILEPNIYAGTREEGIKRARLDNENLIDWEEWQTPVGGNIIGIQALGDNIYYATAGNATFRLGNPNPLTIFNSNIQSFKVEEEYLTITSLDQARVFDSNFNTINTINSFPGFEDQFQSGLAFGQEIVVGTFENGLLRVPFGSNNPTQILPDGPILNSPFALDTSPGQVWVAFGDISVSFNPFPLSFRGISNLWNDEWRNISKDSIFGASDIVEVTINPLNSNEVYFSSFQQGLLRVVDQTPEVLLDETNSGLEINPNLPNAGIRIFGADFDRDNNLWLTQSKVERGLQRLSPSGQFTGFDLSEIIDAEAQPALNRLKVSREGFIFFGTVESGLIGFNPQNGALNSIAEGVGNGNLPENDIRALAFDNNNRLWIGTREGLRVLFNVSGFFDQNNPVEAQEIIIIEDGVPQELLFEQTVTDIEVDGSNNKWLATATSGVFYVSENGQETLLRFTKENSPLPSDNIQDIAIDGSTGRVYFATTNGLVAYEGTATTPRDNLENVYAFPNPVRPGFTGNVTIDGLTADANVKITDIEGNLVFETTSEGGSVLWDTTAFGKYKVASGVYMVLITAADNLETKVTKIMVVR